MQRSAILTATLLSALGLTYIGCTQDFNQFEPTGGGATGGGGGASSSSTASSGSTGGMGGMGGAGGGTTSSSSGVGGGTPCSKNSDCPMDTACRNWSCTMGQCAFVDDPNNTPLPNQTDGDCKSVVCDGAGNEKTINDDADVPPPDGNMCTTEACSNGTPMTTDAPTGTSCNAGICDGMGKCVECIANADCNVAAGQTCFQGTCVSCNDSTKNGDETGVDCGGSCKACDGTTCAMGADCASGNCADGLCCDTACGGTCLACNVTGKEGTCSNVPSGTEDPNGMTACMTTSACNGMGLCKLKAGQTCGNNGECLSNVCSGMGANKTCQ